MNRYRFLTPIVRSLVRVFASRNRKAMSKRVFAGLSVVGGLAFNVIGLRRNRNAHVYAVENQSTKVLPKIRNLVFKGGGPKGIAYAGALLELEQQLGSLDEVKRVAGTSAGAITATLLAVGYTPKEIDKILTESQSKFSEFIVDKDNEKAINQMTVQLIDVAREEKNGVFRVLKLFGTCIFHPIKSVKLAKKIFYDRGMCSGDEFRLWMDDLISKKVAEIEVGDQFQNEQYRNLTFGQLQALKAKQDSSPYKELFIIGAFYEVGQTSNQEGLTEIVYSADQAGMENYIIADAVRVSMSIPGLFRPHGLYYLDQTHQRRHIEKTGELGVDGGLLNNYPIDLFDRNKYLDNPFGNQSPEAKITNYETLGFKLEQKPLVGFFHWIRNLLIGKKSEVEETVPRDIVIDPRNVSLLDFNLTLNRMEELKQSGKSAVATYFQTEVVVLSQVQYQKNEEAKNINNRLIQKHKQLTNLNENPVTAGYVVPDEYDALWPIIREKKQQVEHIGITGISGTGKSQLAFCLADQYAEYYFWECWRKQTNQKPVIWVINSDSQESILRDYGLLALRIIQLTNANNLPKIIESKLEEGKLLEPFEQDQLFRFVNAELIHYPHWMLVFNQTDNQEVLSWLNDKLPHSQQHLGVIVYAGQNMPQVHFHLRKPLDLSGGLSLERAKQLFEGLPGDSSELINTLYRLPLALHRAADEMRITRIDCTQYLEEYNRQWQRVQQLTGLNEEERNNNQFIAQQVTIYVTLQRLMNNRNKEVESLLYLCSILPSEYIDSSILKAFVTEHHKDTTDQVLINRKYESAIQLIGSILVPTGSSFRMHELVQHVIQLMNRELETQSQLLIDDKIITVMNAFLENKWDKRYVGIDENLRSLIHKLSAYFYSRYNQWSNLPDETFLQHLAILNYNLGKLFSYSSQISDAKKNYELALAIEAQLYGQEHVVLASTLNNLGNVYGDLGEYETAKGYYERALRIVEQTHGTDHIVSADTLNNLGNVYNELGEYEQAKGYYERALRIKELTHGKDHIKAADTLNNLGIVYSELGEYEQAKGYYERALRIVEQAHGKDHITAAGILNNLGGLCHELGEYEQAKKYVERALKIVKRTYPKGHQHEDIIRRNIEEIDRKLEVSSQRPNIQPIHFSRRHFSIWRDPSNNSGVVYRRPMFVKI